MRQIAMTCMRELVPEERQQHDWIGEREQAIAALRRLCNNFGDNSWDDDLHLADIIDGYLAPYITGQDE
jgi:hypothetical protein